MTYAFWCADKKKFVEFYSNQILKDLYQKETFNISFVIILLGYHLLTLYSLQFISRSSKHQKCILSGVVSTDF